MAHSEESLLALKGRIDSLPLADKFRLVAEFIDAGPAVDRDITLRVAEAALWQLQVR